MEVLYKLPSWQRIVILFVFPLALLVYVWLLLLSPTLEEVKKLTDEIDRVRAEVQNIQRSMNPKIIENLKNKEEATKKLLEEKEKELTAIVGNIPGEKDIGMILRQVGVLARESGLTIINVQMGPRQEVLYTLETSGNEKFVKEVQEQQQKQKQEAKKVEGVKYLRSELKMALLGKYENFKKFMEYMAEGGLISYPSSINLTQAEGGKLKGDISLYLLLSKEGNQLRQSSLIFC